MTNQYQTDIMGDTYDSRTLNFPDDYEGKVIAILIRRLTAKSSNKAVLYIHGFNDYFFQYEFAEKVNEKGYNFYALDLRKYGRSWLPHQKFNNVRDLQEYDEEILETLEIIKEEGNQEIILIGHSMGGLILSNFLNNHNLPNIKGLILNSPFYRFDLPFFKSEVLLPIGSILGIIFPNFRIKIRFNKLYGESLHNDYHGEWNYNLSWKPHKPPKMNLGFLHAIYKAQKKFRKGIDNQVPVLILSSHRSTQPSRINKYVMTSDIILDVYDIQNGAKYFKNEVSTSIITYGMHDLLSSSIFVRNNAYNEMFGFMDTIHHSH